MADINTAPATGRHKGGKRRKTLSTRVDMTPMVDLGFLLITFFMLTTTLTRPKTMNLLMPRTDGDPMQLASSKALTIMLGGQNRVGYYEGASDDPVNPPQVRFTGFAAHNGIGDVIRSRRRHVLDQYGKNELMVLIKADDNANYGNMVDILDEMLINDVDRYALVDLTEQERKWMR